MKKSKILLVALVAFSLVLTGCTDAVKTKKEEVSKVIKTAAVDSSVRSDLMDRLEAAKTVEEITAIADEIEAVVEAINETIAQVDDLIRTINTKGDMENAAVKEISDSLFILKAEFIITNVADFDVTAAQAKIQELTEKVNAAVGA